MNMCLYPRIIKNRRYLGYRTNKNDRPTPSDYRHLYVAIGCGNCIECRRQKAREWQVRLHEELKVHKKAYFVTLTFAPLELEKLCEENGNNANKIATISVRRFLERYRKKYKHSIKHWFITELGHTGTERLHLHGIIFTDDIELNNDLIANIWKYGITYTGDYCNNKTINYVVKYVTKIDTDHKDYKAIILASKGLGRTYIDNPANKQKHRFNGKETIEYYTLPNGTKINLPIYYRNHLWTQKEREQLWTNTLDKDRTFVRGIEIRNISGEGYNKYIRLLEEQQHENKALGYGSTENEWRQHDYKITFDMLHNKKDDFAK